MVQDKLLFMYFTIILGNTYSIELKDLNIPPEHMGYVFNSFPDLAKSCEADINCPYKRLIGLRSCWGYERDCLKKYSYSVKPECPGDHKGWVRSKEKQYETFFTQADFGYVQSQIDEQMVICEASHLNDSSIECSKNLRFCRLRNIFFAFNGLVSRGDYLRYQTDMLGPGEIGAYCKLYRTRLHDEANHLSALQSWAPELRNIKTVVKRPTLENEMCQIVIQKPTYIMKIDANFNMYHHFCDFFNLYASLHINSTHPSTFSKDNHILIWETYTYDSIFKDTFKAFTKNPIWDLKKFRGKTVCFKNAVMPLLPRMIFGLYYNTPLIYGCRRSGLFHAFCTHILHSLSIEMHPRPDDKVRVTLLSRGTKYRNILNEGEIMDALEKAGGYRVRRVVFDKNVPFTTQLDITRNTDVFVGMHGAGLTHLLFLPDWAAVFEVYNCEDPNCYFDLARLRGIKYVTWENNTKLVQQDEGKGPHGAHAKFTNYSFDVEEFLRLVAVCADHVREQPAFRDFVGATASPNSPDDEMLPAEHDLREEL